MSCDPESQHESAARRLLEAQYSQPFAKVCPKQRPGSKVVDLESQIGSPRRADEVKVLTSQELQQLQREVDKWRSFDSQVLAKRWSVILEARTLGDVLVPIPTFQEPDPSLVRDMEAAGFKVLSAAEREDEFRRRHEAQWRTTPRVRRMSRELEPDLKILEEARVQSTRTGHLPTPEALEAWRRIAARTHGAICMSRDLIR